MITLEYVEDAYNLIWNKGVKSVYNGITAEILTDALVIDTLTDAGHYGGHFYVQHVIHNTETKFIIYTEFK